LTLPRWQYPAFLMRDTLHKARNIANGFWNYCKLQCETDVDCHNRERRGDPIPPPEVGPAHCSVRNVK